MFEQTEQFKNICSEILGHNYNTNKLNGGINNPTYLINNKKNSYVLKKINSNPSSLFDRYVAEKQFLNLTNIISGINTPKLLYSFDTERVLILEYIKPDNAEYIPNIDQNKINECVNFINKINLDKELGKKIITQNASDSYLDLTGHIENIDFRLKNFSTNHISEQYKESAENLLYLLKAKWIILRIDAFSFLEKNIIQNSIDQNYLKVSPSDFGFHNIIIKNNSNYFIDFEFSGWDDPAKLYCDFILQPKFPIPSSFHQLLKEQLIGKDYISKYEKRIDLLYKILKFKWLTIKYAFLNETKYKLKQFNHNNLFNLNSKEYLNEIH
jgi:tRNA A-37 threonylcarbamoyl transferase component Bud32